MRDDKKDEIVRQREWGWWVWFQDAIQSINTGRVYDIRKNNSPYEHQLIYIILINNYVYHLVWYYDKEKESFSCITLFPSRKSHKKFIH